MISYSGWNTALLECLTRWHHKFVFVFMALKLMSVVRQVVDKNIP